MKKLSILLLAAVCALILCSCGKGVVSDVKTDTIKSPDLPSSPVQPQEPKDLDTRISFAAVGDMISYTGTIRDAKSCAVEGGRPYNFAPIFANVRHVIEGADIAFINQETPLAGESFGYSSYPHFNTPRDIAYDIAEAGFDVVNIATNHMLDQGSKGLEETIKFWNTLPVTVIGGYLDENDLDNFRIIEKDNIKIAFLSYTYSTNGYRLQSGYDIKIPYIDEALIERQSKAAGELADLVFVSMHWGNENSMKTNASQRDLARKMCSWGVDVIIGHHPHAIQPVEWVVEGENRLLCVYSLGNFAAEQEFDYQLLGGLVTLDIVRENGEIFIDKPILHPTVYYYDKRFYKNSTYLFEDFTVDMEKSHGISHYGRSISIEKLRSYVLKTVSKEFLPQEWQ